MHIDISSNYGTIKSLLIEPLKREAPFIMSHTINETLRALKAKQSREIGNYLEKKPSNYTKKDNFYIKSSKRNLVGYYGWGYRSHYTPKLIEDGKVKPHKGNVLVEMNPNAGKKFKTGNRLKKNIIQKIADGGVTRGRGKGKKPVRSAIIKRIKGTYGAWELMGWKAHIKKNGKKGKARFHGVRLIAQLEDKSRYQEKRYPSTELGIKFIESRVNRQAVKSMNYALRKYNSWMVAQLAKGGYAGYGGD